jgi:transcriptional regulator with XRE-family HTH domain
MTDTTTTRKAPEQTFPRRQMGTATLEELVGNDPELHALAEAQRAVVDAAALVRTLRETAGLSQRELAKRARTTQAQVSAVERAIGPQGPTVELLARLVAACGERLVLVPVRAYAKHHAAKRLEDMPRLLQSRSPQEHLEENWLQLQGRLPQQEQLQKEQLQKELQERLQELQEQLQEQGRLPQQEQLQKELQEWRLQELQEVRERLEQIWAKEPSAKRKSTASKR